MTKVFDEYSTYYNLLYQDKDYAKEADYVSNLIQKFCPNAKYILELGCGTGKHASLLLKKDYNVFGIDLSETMLHEAKKLNIDCTEGDVRTFRANRTFDAVISLFHVASYQITNQDLKDYFETANTHLEKNGIFIFDVWYGPAVLSQKPESRIKHLENEHLKIERKATPKLYENDNCVDVNYEISIKNKLDNNENMLNETHKVRYLFKPELELMLNTAGFEMIYAQEWLSEKELGFETWGACIAGVKRQ